jgi:hypothetical protein
LEGEKERLVLALFKEVSDQGKQDVHLEWLRKGGLDEALRCIFDEKYTGGPC